MDLGKGKVRVDETPEGYARAFLGGSGLACRMLVDMVGPDTDPLSPDNVLIFMAGPLTGTKAPCCGRYTICSKSPLTGIWGESNAGGYFGPRMKFSGFDGLVIVGRSEEPVYLYVHDGEAELRLAKDLWGLTTFEAQEALRRELGEDVSVACIGPAGEKLVRFACVLNDGGRAAGRCGMGAVMGSKRLKAVAVSGRGEVPVADPEGLEEAASRAREAIEESMLTGIFREFGTAGYVDYAQELGDMPNRYFSQGRFEEADRISGMTMAETIQVGRRACYGCPIGCGRVVEVREGRYTTPRTDGPGYEALAAFGSNLLVDD
ncbi:aldehyde ferredoxin oxidoreductase, partial [Candidatus Bathyarchaeota archaeon]